jgi:hypothetical protein
MDHIFIIFNVSRWKLNWKWRRSKWIPKVWQEKHNLKLGHKLDCVCCKITLYCHYNCETQIIHVLLRLFAIFYKIHNIKCKCDLLYMENGRTKTGGFQWDYNSLFFFSQINLYFMYFLNAPYVLGRCFAEDHKPLSSSQSFQTRW